MYPDTQKNHFNVNNMTIAQWFDSEPMRQARMMMFDSQKNDVCRRCYLEEQHSSTSRRHRANQKSVIFTRENFEDSFLQSPNFDKFEASRQNNGSYSGLPIDLHIDLGNYCNLTCKMCRPQASSSIADQYRRWGIVDAEKYIGTDWTRNIETWNRVLDELANISLLKNIHFMGGETLITQRFEQFVDFMIDRNRLDLSFSFVTNGTKFNLSLIEKLKKFRRVGIEVSIESLTLHNAYQRQGSDTQQVLENINRYLAHCDNDRISLTIRPAISLLTIGSYHTLLQYALDHRLVVKSLMVYRPDHLMVPILPDSVKGEYLKIYNNFMLINSLESENCSEDYNESDPHQIRKIIKNQVLLCQNLLKSPRPINADDLLAQMVSWCQKWDHVHGYDALTLYPEMADIFIKHGYQPV